MNYKLRIALLLLLSLLWSCSSDMLPDCFKEAGTIITYDAEVGEFNALNVGEGIEVILKEGDERKVTVETGENLKDDISITVTNGELSLKNNSGCNWIRDYNITKIYVTTPVLERIYSASQFAVRSNGVLAFPNLELLSGLYNETASGVFELEVNCQNLTVQDNQSIYCEINGYAENLSVSFYSGDARFEGAGLVAQNVDVYHRSSNNIIVNPQQQVTGTIASTGNLVLVNQPPVMQVGQLYTGGVVYW